MNVQRLGFERRDVIVIGVLFLAVCLAVVLRLVIGEPIPRSADGAIVWKDYGQMLSLRSSRIVIALTVGVALAVSGALLQALLRNRLASPYVLGLSSGAAVGVMVHLYVLHASVSVATAWLEYGGSHVAALLGAGISMLIVYSLSQKRGWVDPIGLLLVGVILNAIAGALIMFIQYLVPNGLRGDMLSWMMGRLNDSVGEWTLVPVVLMTTVGWAIAVWLGRSMDVATFSDTEAHALGLNLQRLRLIMFVLAGALTAGAVVLAGPIGFVGLICPHLVRLLIGPRHRALIVAAALTGAGLLVLADAVIKWIDVYVYPIGQLPLGVLTALIGGPLFLVLLRPQLGRGTEQ